MPTAIEKQREVFRIKNHRELEGRLTVKAWARNRFISLKAASEYIDDRLDLGFACSMKREDGIYMVTVWGPAA